MTTLEASSTRLSFGLFEADVRSGELWKAGRRVRLQGQPFKLLAMLLERPNEVVTREELQERLWGKNTVVDFDHSLGTAVNKIREALGDSAESPLFIETLSRRGYRFIAPVRRPVESGEESELVRKPGGGGGLSPEAGAAAGEPGPVASALSNEGAASPARIVDLAPGQIGDLAPGQSGNLAPGQSPEMRVPQMRDAGAEPFGASTGFARGRFAGPATLVRRHVWFLLTAVAALVVVVAAVLAAFVGYRLAGPRRDHVVPPRIVQVTHNDHLAPTISTMEDLRAGATDGVHLFASTISNGHSGLSSIALNFGTVDPLVISEEVMAPSLADLSPDSSQLLVRSHLSPESEQPLWVVPAAGGSARRVGEVMAHDAAWMPDGQGILFAAGNELYTTQPSGESPALFARLPGRAFWMRWQPGGGLLRFTLLDTMTHTTSLWQLSARDRTPVRILTHSGRQGNGCCGVWADGGAAFVFQSSDGEATDLWKLSDASTDAPVRLTAGPLQYQSPVAARFGPRVYFLGVDARSQLARLGPGGTLIREEGFLAAAVRVDASRDGRWVAWTDGHGALWRARSDGSDVLQLTAGLDVFLARWSPDATRLAMMAREPGKAWQLYTIGSSGGEPRRLLQEDRNAADPSWSPDGQRIVFGRVNDFMGKEQASRDLEILDLRSSRVSTVPESEGLFSPRWSPDGKYIAALTLDQRRVKLFDVGAKRWETLPVSSGADLVWTADSRSLVVHASMDPRQPIDRILIPERKVSELVQLAKGGTRDAVDFVFVGLAADGSPLVRSRTYTGNVYSLDLR